VINFDRKSSGYGQIIRTVPLPGNSTNNEPHHVGLSADGRTLAVGGLLSVLTGQPDSYFFDVSNPTNPVFIKSDDPPNATITDEFSKLSNGGFMVTFMGGPNGAAPGRVVEYNGAMNRVAEWPAVLPTDGFDPHGIAINEAENLMVTSDFICPLATLHIEGGNQAHFRGKIRVWDFAARVITNSITVGDPGTPAGTIDVQLIPNDLNHRAFTAGLADNGLYLIDTELGTSTKVFDFSIYAVPNAPVWPSLIRINDAGNRMYITLNYVGQAGKVVAFNITNPSNPIVIGVADLGAGSGPHYLKLSPNEKRLVVSDYFLVEDIGPGGIVQAEGDHKIHVLSTDISNGLIHEEAEWPGLDFDTAFAWGPSRPHGIVIK
jgi:selenium-binding protein 1